MNQKSPSKLQIRAEIMSIIQHLLTFDEIPKAVQDSFAETLKGMENLPYILEILIKELLKSDYKKSKIVSFFIIELGTLEQLGEVLWSFIKDSGVSDETKDVISVILRGLGDTSDPEDFLNYLSNPKEVIARETERLLEISYINPEAQIDFMDFLFSLPEHDKIMLIHSLKEDYPGEYLANLLITILETNPDDKIKETIIEILGETKCSSVVSILNDIIKSSTNELHKKMAQKSLKLLKISGVDISKEEPDLRGYVICAHSKIYKCFASEIDGAGNQGLIISRLKDNNDIIMFSIAINDTEGILDCFGFNGISNYDFARIVAKFQENSTRIPVLAEYCKDKIVKAAELTKKIDDSLPYEYVAWKSLIYDIPELDTSIFDNVLTWGTPNLVNQSKLLYNYNSYKHWFLGENDNDIMKNSLIKIISTSKDQKDEFLNYPMHFIAWIEEEVKNAITAIFTVETRELFYNRLVNMAYLLDLQDQINYRNITSSVAQSLKGSNQANLCEIPFLKEYVKKTIWQGYLRYQDSLNAKTQDSDLIAWGRKKSKTFEQIVENEKVDLNNLLNILEANW